jgi:AmmeMemoRadiSam system protein A
MSSPESLAVHAPALGAIARASIEKGLLEERALHVDVGVLPAALRERRATFVTLKTASDGSLRGCTGSVEPSRPLALDVAHAAFNSAFRDRRFPRVRSDEIAELDLFISVLSPLAPLPAASEAELQQALRPGVDGIAIAEGPRFAVFLPSVWEQLPAPRDFLRELRKKAGLPPDYWSAALRVQRFGVEYLACPAERCAG